MHRFEPKPRRRYKRPLNQAEAFVLSIATGVLTTIIMLTIALILLLVTTSPADAQEVEPLPDHFQSVVITGSDQDLEIAGRLGDKLIERLGQRVKHNEEQIAGLDRRNDDRVATFRRLAELQDAKRAKMIERVEGQRKGMFQKIADNRQEMKRLKTNLTLARAELAAQRKWMLAIVAATAVLFLIVLKFK